MKVAIFIPCIVEKLFPKTGMGMVKLLESEGCELVFPKGQTCCGQPFSTTGNLPEELKLAQHMVEVFSKAEYDYIVGPAAACTSEIKSYATLLKDNNYSENLVKNAQKMDSVTYELVEFLTDILKIKKLKKPVKFPHKVGIHHSCTGTAKHALSNPKEMKNDFFSKPKQLLDMVEGIETTLPSCDGVCCGFGGLFSNFEGDVSATMGLEKIQHHIDTGAEYITSTDNSCLMHLDGLIKENGLNIKTLHIAQILSGIGE